MSICDRLVPVSVLTALLFQFHAVSPAVALPLPVASEILRTGGQITVGHELSTGEIDALLAAGGDRVTVDCTGFEPEDVTSFRNIGARVVLDASFPSSVVGSLCQWGAGHVSIVPDGFSFADLLAFSRAGGDILDTNPASSFQDKLRSLESGGKATVTQGMDPRDVLTLIGIGKARVVVFASGFNADSVWQFLNAGAIICVDDSFAVTQVRKFCRAGTDRVVVLAAGFSPMDLVHFAKSGVHIHLTGQRDAARKRKFAELEARSAVPAAGLTP